MVELGEESQKDSFKIYKSKEGKDNSDYECMNQLMTALAKEKSWVTDHDKFSFLNLIRLLIGQEIYKNL